MTELAEKTKSLSALDLNSLLETSKVLVSSDEADEMLSHALRTVMGKFLISRAAICLIESQGETERYVVVKSRGIANAPKRFSDLRAFMNDCQFAQSVPLVSKTRPMGYLLLGKKLTDLPYSDSDIAFLESLAALAASALENALSMQEVKRLNRSLDQTIQKLKTLLELANSYHVGLSRDEILKIFSHSVSGQMLLRSYLVVLRGESGKPLTELSLGVEVQDLARGQQFQFELEKTLQVSTPTRVSHDDFPSLYLAGLRYVVPMRNNDKTIGAFICGERPTQQPFTDTDLEFVSLAAAQAATALEQARLFKETLEIQAMEKEMQVAKEIQAALLPKSLPNISGVELAARNIPAKQVGGDYYDIARLDERHLFLGIADVTGKGAPAALLMANLQAFIKAHLTAFHPDTFDLSKVVGKINNIIYENTPADKFITFFGAIFNRQTRQLFSVNAGHNPPILLKASGEIQRLCKGGVILGVISTLAPYDYEITSLTSGDILLLYTDGVTESMSERREEFGEARLLDLLRSNRHKSASDIVAAIVSEIERFQSSGEQRDDITLVCLKLS
ncbi:MAG: PP2C family protein-serine/threonine phosphatase [Chloroherpetonaceae bacterium]|nr:PP2C family protein-serine/threonine phosphatase [Chloroherpetonaceae bacterium]MDW8436714.1 PP2C family protein-serine/threonine phosphatase [Chloroherpetonaceae bacterium]